MFPKLYASACAGLLACAASAPGAEFHPIAGVTSDTAATDHWPVSNLVAGPGSGFDASVPHAQLGSGSGSRWVTNAPNGGSGDYFSPLPSPRARLVFDLGQNRALSEISVWGYANTNANGVMEFELRFATAAEGTAGFGASIGYNPVFSPVQDESPRQSFPFSQTVTARYVELLPTDNFYAVNPSGGDRIGIGEVAFEDAVPANDPAIVVPAGIALDLDGSVQTIAVPVTNGGAAIALAVSGASFSGPEAAAFSVISLPAPIAPGATADLLISFDPTSVSGAVAAALAIASNDAETPSAAISLSGFVHDPKLELPVSFNLGAFPGGAGAQTAALPVSNAGGGKALTITSATVGGPDAARFSVDSFPASLPPAGAGSIGLTFTPDGDRTYTATLTVASDDAMFPVRTVNLSARVGDAVPGAGLRINEFMAVNDSGIDDGDGNRSDWIEIHNAGPGEADLSGYYLTDSAGNLTKWRFPSGVVLPDGGFLLVFASGQNADGYVDGAGYLHTNFRLSSSGEYLGLIGPDGETVVDDFAPAFPFQFSDIPYGVYQGGGSSADAIAGSDAAWLVPTDGSLGTTWTAPSFAQGAAWDSSGTGTGVGFDGGSDYDVWIDIDVEAALRGVHPSIYIRIPFTVEDASAVTAIDFAARYDDGFVAYLNGTEIASRNAPAAPVWDSTATQNQPEPLSLEHIDATGFRAALLNGDNVLAIHGLNRSSGSSDFVIDPQLTLSLAGSGAPQLGYLAVATPGAPNTGGPIIPGPTVGEVAHLPAQPAASEDLVVTAAVEPRLAPVSGVELHYRVGYGAEAAVTMRDDGAAPDAVAGDGIWTVAVPASAYSGGDMLRWRVVASDGDGNASNAPPFLVQTGHSQSAQYFGTVVEDPAAASGLPVFHWFTTNPSAGHTRSGVRASVFFAGRFYDNVFVRSRGGATNGSVSQKFDFNKGEPFYVDDTMPKVSEININGNGADPTYVRQTLAFDAHRVAGVASCQSALWQLRVNGGADRVGVFIEQVDEDFLDRNGYDEDGDLYKMVQRSNLNPVFFDTITGIEKKTNDKGDLSSIADLVAGLNLPTSAERRRYVIDELDLPQVCNYLAVRSIIQDADDLRKNFYVYRDIRGDDRWRMFPWDKDFTFGILGDGGTHLPHPFFGDEEHKKQNADQWNILYDVIFEETTTQRLYLRRLRTLMDELLQSGTTPAAERYFENRADEIIAPASPPLSGNLSAVDSYLNSRRNVLFNNYPSLIPGPQPADPDITITGAEHNPPSGNQDEEYLVLQNHEATEIDLSGWCLAGGVEFTFAPGTVIERGGALYVSPDTLAFRNRAASPTGGEERLSVGPYSGHLSNFGETVLLLDRDKVEVASFTTPVDPSDAQLYLVISEIMYHPADPTPDAEFIELMNISDTVTLDLAGVRFTAGIDYAFPAGTTLAPGARVAVHFADFAGGSRLNNGSDRLKLEDATGSTIKEFSYNDDPPWPTAPDGGGPSLVLIRPAANPDPADPANWRASAAPGGNPGLDDAIPYAGGDLGSYLLAAPPELAVSGGQVLFSYTARTAADGAFAVLQQSGDLVGWVDVGGDALEFYQNDGTTRYGITSPAPDGRLFLRLRFVVRE